MSEFFLARMWFKSGWVVGFKLRYPSSGEVAEAIREVLAKYPLLKPDELVDRVREVLEEDGRYAGLVTAKRVWRLYEEMVRRGVIYDVLGVVEGK